MFQELDYQPTPIGPVSLRKRMDLASGGDVYEIKLGDEFLMSSRFTVSEIALARLGIAAHGGTGINVVVGGLGLGYTAKAALENDDVSALLVVEMLAPVIEWHETGLLPVEPPLTSDRRCRLISGDFFRMVSDGVGFDPESPGRLFDAILLDIDHSPDMLLNARSRPFYEPHGLQDVVRRLRPGGIFALWSNDPPDETFTARLACAFTDAWAEPVTFHNPLQNRQVVQTVYLARHGQPGT